MMIIIGRGMALSARGIISFDRSGVPGRRNKRQKYEYRLVWFGGKEPTERNVDQVDRCLVAERRSQCQIILMPIGVVWWNGTGRTNFYARRSECCL